MDEKPVGDVAEAFKTAARVIEAEYEWPFQSHACMGPACAVVEIKDGRVTCYTGSQKPHFVRDGLARTLEVPPANVDGIWVVGPGSYGRNDADDCAHDAAVLAKLTGKPVRLQYTREQGTGWDPKGPASIHKARAALDASNKVVAYEFVSKGFSRIDVQTNGSRPEDTLAGHFRGVALKVNDNFGVPAEVLRVRQQADGMGDDRAVPGTGLAAARRAPARSGRAANPLRVRVFHGRGRERDQRRPG